jgi:hypothetical protein
VRYFVAPRLLVSHIVLLSVAMGVTLKMFNLLVAFVSRPKPCQRLLSFFLIFSIRTLLLKLFSVYHAGKELPLSFGGRHCSALATSRFVA